MCVMVLDKINDPLATLRYITPGGANSTVCDQTPPGEKRVIPIRLILRMCKIGEGVRSTKNCRVSNL